MSMPLTCSPQVVVTFRRTSRLSMRIGRSGEVRVSAPLGCTQQDVVRFIDEHRDWIKRARVKADEARQRREDFYSRLPLSTRKERAEAVARLEAIVGPMIERHARQMGVKPAAIGFRATVSRWGACSVRSRRIQFSLYLLLLPPWCIEHVVVHELAHLLVPNHSPRFYAVMDRHFPLWREARKETKRISQSKE